MYAAVYIIEYKIRSIHADFLIPLVYFCDISGEALSMESRGFTVALS